MPISLGDLSSIGIGMYRMCLNNQENEKALIKALTKHINNNHNTNDNKIINVIDTSTNYCDGGSEELIGKVLSSHDKKILSRDEICIASKFGYCQGKNLALYHSGHFKNIPNDHIVQYSHNCYHCIHPIFMRDQLNRTLNRLRTKYIDIWFIHNPEKEKATIKRAVDVIYDILEIESEIISLQWRDQVLSFVEDPFHRKKLWDEVENMIRKNPLVRLSNTTYEGSSTYSLEWVGHKDTYNATTTIN
ncbi:20899_t:CDS:2 [Entrophospora sp. SA101]|nr:20899_t:CDS:2 [Entrophospora sp. SA101]